MFYLRETTNRAFTTANFKPTDFFPVFDESFEPEKQSFVDSDFVMPEGLDDLDMSLTDLRTRENVAEMMLGLCCEAEDFCLQDLWAEICDSLHLDQTTCFPLYHQKCSRIGGAEPSGK